MAHVLITGGAGFIGARTARRLAAAGHRVRVLDVLDPQIHGPRAAFPPNLPTAVEKTRGDVRDRRVLARALRGVTAVYHFAARTGTGQGQYEVADYVDTNVGGAAALLNAVVRLKHPPRLILASSRAVYGEGPARCARHGTGRPAERRSADLARGDFDLKCPACGGRVASRPCPENHPPDPRSLYALTKKHQEDLFRETARAHDLSVVVLRYFNVYGAGQSLNNPYTGVATVFFNRLRDGVPLDLYEGGVPTRDFVHVDDVARANVAALSLRAPGAGPINIGGGRAVTVRAFAAALARAMGRPARFRDEGLYRAGDIVACTADLRRARRVLGFRPRVSLESGLKEFVDWARALRPRGGRRYETSLRELRRFGLLGKAR